MYTSFKYVSYTMYGPNMEILQRHTNVLTTWKIHSLCLIYEIYLGFIKVSWNIS